MVIRLDARHWIHRWDKVVVKQTHMKYGDFMRGLSAAVLAYCSKDLQLLIRAVRSSDAKYQALSDSEMHRYLKKSQLQSYVRRFTRGEHVTFAAVERLLNELKGPAGLDSEGIPLFKSHKVVDEHWAIAQTHLSCMQDPPGVSLYRVVKTVTIGSEQVYNFKSDRGSNSLEGLHAHIPHAIPAQRCSVIQAQVSFTKIILYESNSLNQVLYNKIN